MAVFKHGPKFSLAISFYGLYGVISIRLVFFRGEASRCNNKPFEWLICTSRVSHYIEVFNRPATDISWIVSFEIFILSLGSSVAGRLFDAGYYRHLMISGFLIQLLGVFSTSFVKTYWQAFLTHGVCGGIASTLLWTTHVSLISTWFLKRRTFAIALTLCGTSLGGMVWVVIAQQLIPTIGFQWTVRVIGFMMTAFFAIVLAITRTRIPPRKGGPFLDLPAFKEVSYSCFVIGTFLILFSVYFAFFFVNQYATNIIHVDGKTSLSILYLMNGVSVIGRILPALIADYAAGPVAMYIFLSFCAGVIMYAWIAVHSLGGIIAFAAAYGFFGAGVQGLLGAAMASMTPDLQKIGVRLGMVLSVGSIPCLTGSPLAGALIQLRGGDYLDAQIFGGTTLVIGSMVVFLGYLSLMERRRCQEES